jgi:subtilase family serine protease
MPVRKQKKSAPPFLPAAICAIFRLMPFGKETGLAALFFCVAGMTAASAAPDRLFLPGHVPQVVRRLSPIGTLPETNQLRLAIGLPLRNQAGLDGLLRQLYDPASTNYHKFLQPAELATRFGPTELDYQAVRRFAESNGLTVVATFPNRMVLDVKGPVANIERAFQIRLNRYRHPVEARDFYAPDSEPSVPMGLKIISVEGLNDFSRPRPAGMKLKASMARPLSFNGTGPGHEYVGNDFRNAYVPGTALTGAGQTVAVLEYSDYYKVDITNYENIVGALNNATNYVPLTNVVVGGVVPSTGNNDEVSLDIEMAIAIAPGLSRVMVY